VMGAVQPMGRRRRHLLHFLVHVLCCSNGVRGAVDWFCCCFLLLRFRQRSHSHSHNQSQPRAALPFDRQLPPPKLVHSALTERATAHTLSPSESLLLLLLLLVGCRTRDGHTCIGKRIRAAIGGQLLNQHEALRNAEGRLQEFLQLGLLERHIQVVVSFSSVDGDNLQPANRWRAVYSFLLPSHL
jgi:hypothetical protein